MTSQHVYEIRPRKDKRGVDLISDALPLGRLWYSGPDAANAIGYAEHRSRADDAVIRVYDEAGNVIAEHAGEFKDLLKKSGDRREKDTKPVIARPLQGGSP